MWGAVLQDEVEAEVDHGRGVDLLADAVAGLGKRLIAVEGVVAKGDEGGHAGVGCGTGAQGVVVVSVEVDVGVDEAGEHELALGVDDAVGGRQQVLGGNGHDLLALDRHGGVKDLGRRHYLAAADYGVDPCCNHDRLRGVLYLSCGECSGGTRVFQQSSNQGGTIVWRLNTGALPCNLTGNGTNS